MANEFVHGSVGTTLTQAEFEAVGLHVCNSQATGDLIYASSGSQLSRLAAGTQGYPLVMGASVPQWGGAITLNGTLTINSQVFDAGSGDIQINTTKNAGGLIIQATHNNSAGCKLSLKHLASPPEVDDYFGGVQMYAYNSAGTPMLQRMCYIYGIFTNVTNGAEAVNLGFDLWTGGAANMAMTLTGAGGLSVDADIGTGDDPVALFDSYDDAMVIQKGIQQRNHELLADIGVFTKKDTGSGYMMNIQPMTRLLAGGIYQTRQMLEDTRDKLTARLENVEQKLLGIG